MAQESWKRDHEETGCQHPEGPILCINNCGFFGSAATMNMCSKCYCDIVLKESGAFPAKSFSEKALKGGLADKPSAILPQIKNYCMPMINDATVNLPDVSMPSVEAVLREDVQQPVTEQPGSSTMVQDEQILPAANRCFVCRKRVGLTGFNCRCGDIFCAKHRYSDKHDCSFDYKAAGRAAIAKANPMVKSGKIEKI